MCVLDTVSDSDGKVERKGAKSWITQEIINKMDECNQRRQKEELQKTEERIKTEPLARPRRSILRPYVTRSRNFKE